MARPITSFSAVAMHQAAMAKSVVYPYYDFQFSGRKRTVYAPGGVALSLPEVRIVAKTAGATPHEMADAIGELMEGGPVQIPGTQQYTNLLYVDAVPGYQDETYDETGLPAYLLFARAYGVDASGNIWRTRTAPQSLVGICKPLGGVALEFRRGDFIFACEPPELTRIRAEQQARLKKERADELRRKEFLLGTAQWHDATEADKVGRKEEAAFHKLAAQQQQIDEHVRQAAG